MLKTPDRYPRATVTAYDQVLSQHGARIEVARQRFGEALNQAVQRQSELFFPDGRQLSVKFLSGIQYLLDGVDTDESAVATKFLESLDKNYERDCREGSTRLGPQRSDLACQLNGKPLAQFGSEGECRTAAIALRFGVLELLREQKGQSEITMIVDDVLGELDATRREAFLRQLVASGQVIFAGTALPSGFGENIKTFRIDRPKPRQPRFSRHGGESPWRGHDAAPPVGTLDARFRARQELRVPHGRDCAYWP